MADWGSSLVPRFLGRVVRKPKAGATPDGQLLEDFALRHDEAAFGALIERHGRMVLGVCRQILRNEHDAEDAFQATFLILVQRAGSIRRPESVGDWLYGVAYRVALRAKGLESRRQSKEKLGLEVEAADPGAENQPIELHEELSRLPTKLRVPLVLCYLEGRTHEEAADALQWPVGTVKTRLSEGKDLLRDRLVRRGLAVSVGTLTGLLADPATVAVRAGLLETTVKAGALAGAGKLVGSGVISAHVVSLTQGFAKAMMMTHLKIAAGALLAVAVVGAGAGVIAYWSGTVPSPKPITAQDRAAGMNGSFEVTKSGLPVSWSFYTPQTVPAADFDILMDTADFKDGKQSLQFVVRKCEATGGRLSPGFFNEFPDTKPGETYKISFWAKNAGSEFVFTARGVSAMGREPGVVIKSKETFNEWRRFECTHTIPSQMWLRLELNVVQPGTFWIDDIQMAKVNDKAK